MFPVRKKKKGLTWPCRLWVLIGEHGSATIKWIKGNWFFCKYNCTAMSQSTYLSCNYIVFSTHSSQSSLQKGIYIQTHCLSFISHVLCKAFKKDSQLIFHRMYLVMNEGLNLTKAGVQTLQLVSNCSHLHFVRVWCYCVRFRFPKIQRTEY